MKSDGDSRNWAVFTSQALGPGTVARFRQTTLRILACPLPRILARGSCPKLAQPILNLEAAAYRERNGNSNDPWPIRTADQKRFGVFRLEESGEYTGRLPSAEPALPAPQA